jgi:hypothetical protein
MKKPRLLKDLNCKIRILKGEFIMDWLIILSVYLIISVFATIFSLALLDESEIKHYPLKTIFVFQDKLYNYAKYELNIFGIIILEIIITVLTLGASIMMLVTLVTIWVFMLIWKAFCFVFKKR